jgi:hypothetical protein
VKADRLPQIILDGSYLGMRWPAFGRLLIVNIGVEPSLLIALKSHLTTTYCGLLLKNTKKTQFNLFYSQR